MKAQVLFGNVALGCVLAGPAMAHGDGAGLASSPVALEAGLAAAAIVPLVSLGREAIDALTQGGGDQHEDAQASAPDAYDDPQTDDYGGGGSAYGNAYAPAADYGNAGAAYGPGEGYPQGYPSDEAGPYNDPQTDDYGDGPPGAYGYGPAPDAGGNFDGRTTTATCTSRA